MSGESSVFEISTSASPGLKTAQVSLVNSSAVAVFQAAQFNFGGDMWIYWTDGAPVDYTDGTPPATGEAEAGIGSLCMDYTNGKLYINGGTKAQPIWKLVTSAA